MTSECWPKNDEVFVHGVIQREGAHILPHLLKKVYLEDGSNLVNIYKCIMNYYEICTLIRYLQGFILKVILLR